MRHPNRFLVNFFTNPAWTRSKNTHVTCFFANLLIPKKDLDLPRIPTFATTRAQKFNGDGFGSRMPGPGPLRVCSVGVPVHVPGRYPAAGKRAERKIAVFPAPHRTPKPKRRDWQCTRQKRRNTSSRPRNSAPHGGVGDRPAARDTGVVVIGFTQPGSATPAPDGRPERLHRKCPLVLPRLLLSTGRRPPLR